MARLVLRGIHKAFGPQQVLFPIDLDIADGEFVTLLGPSGCGKSTLLRIISGITAASGGEIELGGLRIDTFAPEQRNVAMVFQSYALFPHMSVHKNLGFGLRMKKVAPAEQRRRLDHAVAICRLEGLLDRMPRQLSGGQQQRVALARAIVMQPALLLFDEPLSNLDAKLRESLRDDLIALHRSVGTTSVYVTHDQAEAMAMSDRILVMHAGRVVESGHPVELYRRPRHAFTAHFLGQTNLLDLAVENGAALTPWGQRVAVSGTAAGARHARVSLRPEDLTLSPNDLGTGCISAVSFAGAQVNYLVQVGAQALHVASSGRAELLRVGERVSLHTGPLCALQGPRDEAAGA
jgi:putative spermidine/putrescine transport system ATP-binding protein